MKKTTPYKELKTKRVARTREIILEIVNGKLKYRESLMLSREAFLRVFEDMFLRRIQIQPHEIMDAAIFYLEAKGYPIEKKEIAISEADLVEILSIKTIFLIREELSQLKLLEMVVTETGIEEEYNYHGMRKRDIIHPTTKDEEVANLLKRYNGAY